jgi:hypothetical protein
MAGMMGWIGEFIDASSWRYGHEATFMAWVHNRVRIPIPFACGQVKKGISTTASSIACARFAAPPADGAGMMISPAR